ncbi:MAG: hypothetical protein CMF50_06595 [Legionellales bacterium]|nr:hypothetical protein [Legionellales bacterium]|tara:strand:+ start:858 stop:1364 length:507 start_codon:yes stop_codon:yes gene_type:complete
MQGITQIRAVASDIKELTTVLIYGEKRLEKFSKELKKLEKQLSQANTHDKINALKRLCLFADASLSTTWDALVEWKDKSEQSLQELHAFAKDALQVEASSGYDLMTLTLEITSLLQMISTQQKAMCSQRARLQQLLQGIKKRERVLQKHITRARAPLIIGENLALEQL